MKETEYRQRWKALPKMEIRMVEKLGKCKHDLGETHHYVNPYEPPPGVCSALLHVLSLYTWRVALGFPSWEPDDDRVFRIHCPSKKGTVWELRPARES